MAGVAGFIAALSVCVFLTVKLPLFLKGICFLRVASLASGRVVVAAVLVESR